MKRYKLILIVAASLAWASALAESRPHYGGTLRVAIREAPQNLDPAASNGPQWLERLVFETLVKLDERGRPQPGLALSWQAEPGNQRWSFLLRSGVSFHDGSPLDANSVAASLRASNPQWKILAAGDSVIIQTEIPDPQVPAELALSRNGILLRSSGKLSGTGPFAIRQWDPGKQAVLTANDQYWRGRAFLDSMAVEFGKNSRDRMMLLELGKSDVIEVEPEDIRRSQAGNRVVMSSKPEEFMALAFARDPQSDDEAHLRSALAMSIDTAALNNVVFQGGGEPTGALLPNWLSGYAFVFADNPQGHREKTVQHPAGWTLMYDAADPIARIVSERILLNARDAGISLQIITTGNADLRLLRMPLPSSDARVALSGLAQRFELPAPKFSGASITALYSAENALLETHRVVPLVYLRSALATRPNVRGLMIFPDGSVEFDNVWLAPEKP